MKTLACGDLVPGCEAVVEAETEEEVLRIAAEHAVSAHGLTVDDGLVAAVRAAIRDESAPESGSPASVIPANEGSRQSPRPRPDAR